MKTSERALRCLVITPVGPGHEAYAQEARATVVSASQKNLGPFVEVAFRFMPDHEGKVGRSQRRNDGIDFALANGFEWIFFLDADDGLLPDAFSLVAPYIENYDAIFGLIVEARAHDAWRVHIRPDQLGATTALADILSCDPFLSLQMGHFVRTTAAVAIRFDGALDIGEDFKYYLELWRQFRAIKIKQPLFVNRRGVSSTGPRAGDGRAWRMAVLQILEDFRERYSLK